jgi:hypothetical protein
MHNSYDKCTEYWYGRYQLLSQLHTGAALYIAKKALAESSCSFNIGSEDEFLEGVIKDYKEWV